MAGYKAVLFALDGDYVTDYPSKTKEEVQEKLADRGSRWFFYPLEAIITDRGWSSIKNQRVVETWEPLDCMVGKSIKSTAQFIKDNAEAITTLSR